MSKALGPVTTFHLVNLSPADAQFIANVVAVFTDPKYESHCSHLRDGQSGIVYEPKGGLALIPLRNSTSTSAKR